MQNHRARARLDHLVWVTDADRRSTLRHHERSWPRTVRLYREVGRLGEVVGSDYGRFSLSNNPVNSRSWNYRGCWHQTCPPAVIEELFGLLSSP